MKSFSNTKVKYIRRYAISSCALNWAQLFLGIFRVLDFSSFNKHYQIEIVSKGTHSFYLPPLLWLDYIPWCSHSPADDWPLYRPRCHHYPVSVADRTCEICSSGPSNPALTYRKPSDCPRCPNCRQTARGTKEKPYMSKVCNRTRDDRYIDC